MILNWPIVIAVAIAAVALLAYLVRQNLKDKKEADREFRNFKEEHTTDYETNDEEL